jgi:integrase/recombinase XerD
MTRKQVLTRFQEQMALKGYAKSTRDTYIIHIIKFLEFYPSKKLSEFNIDDAREFLLDAIRVRKLSKAYTRSVRASIKLLFEGVLEKKWSSKIIPCIRSKRTLPVVLSKKEVNKLFSCVKNFKLLVIFITAYSAGLRISEVASLKVSDIISDTNQIYVEKSKSGGYADRYSILGEMNLRYLRKYYKQYKPKYWLFPSKNSKNHISKSTIHDAFKRVVAESGIEKSATMHSLRHSFATHLLEQGTSILKIKELLGHSNISSTMMYIHLANKDILNVVNPFDDLVKGMKK